MITPEDRPDRGSQGLCVPDPLPADEDTENEDKQSSLLKRNVSGSDLSVSGSLDCFQGMEAVPRVELPGVRTDRLYIYIQDTQENIMWYFFVFRCCFLTSAKSKYSLYCMASMKNMEIMETPKHYCEWKT
jgi:hypothetical protein